MAVLEFKDFSGGITEKNIPGQTNRYSVATNLLIDVDKKLLQRDGFDIFSSTAYQMPQAERVARLSAFDNSSELLAFHNKKAQYISTGAWTELLGPTSNKAFNTNTAASLLSEAQWNHHLYMASNSGDPVIKIYRDGSNVLQMRTAGLPAPATPHVYTTEAAKLAAAITLAVDIKTQLHAHVNDFGVSPAAHLSKDTTTDTALDALSTPVTLANLIAYTKVLRTNYNLHVTDAKLPGTFQAYHAETSAEYVLLGSGIDYIINPILNIATEPDLVADANLTTLAQVVNILNDLRNKYNWHARAPFTHNNATQTSATWGANFVTVAALDVNSFYPAIAPNITTLLRYVNYLKAEYNLHANDASSSNDYAINDYYAHRNADSANLIRMSDATDLHEAVAMIGLLEFHYSQHYEDARKQSDSANFGLAGSHVIVQGTTTAGSAVIASVSPDPTLLISANWYLTRYANADVAAPYSWFNSAHPFLTTVKVVSTTATTITMNANALQSGTFALAFARSALHYDIDRSTSSQTSSGAAAKLFQDGIDLTLVDLESITDAAVAVAVKLKAHMIDGNGGVYTDADLLDPIINYTRGITYYKVPVEGTAPWTGDNFSPHRWAGQGVNYWPTASATVMNGEVDYGQGYFEAGLSVASYSYKLISSYDYTAGAVDFTDLSSPTEPPDTDAKSFLTVLSVVSPVTLEAGSTAARDAISFTNIQVLANASNQNYDTSNIKVEIYRTIGNGSGTYFKVGEVTNGTTTFSDTVMDADLVNNEALYTNGGVKPNGAPPTGATIIHQSEAGYTYYVVGRKIYISLQNDPDSVPEDFFDELNETCTGVCSTRGNVVAFTYNSVLRMEGVLNELGQGFFRHESIFDRTGCIAPTSIVQADNGVFFAGKDGFYYTDGIQCFRASGDLADTFIAYTNSSNKKNRIQATYDSVNKRIYWLMQSSNSSSSADLIWVMDLQFGVQASNTPITTISCTDSFNPTAVVMYGDALHYGDLDGYIFKQVAGSNLDLKKVTSVAATSWSSRTIMWDFKSCHGDFGSPTERKYFKRVLSEFEQQGTNLSVQILSDSDKGRVISTLPIIRSRKLLDWGDSKIDWTASVYTAKDGNVIDEFRRFAGDGSLRSNYRAIEFKNAYCVIVNSTDMGLLNVTNISANLWSLTLANSPSRKWPLYSVDYFVRIANVDYPVTVRTSDSVVRVSDAGLTALTAGSVTDWELWGYPKNERVKFIQYSVSFDLAGDTQKDYQGTTSTDGGENA